MLQRKEIISQVKHDIDEYLRENSIQFINALWSSTVLKFFEAKIDNKFPINQNAQDDISSVDFDKFFNPKSGFYVKFHEQFYKKLNNKLQTTKVKVY